MVKGVPELRFGEAREAMMAWNAVGLDMLFTWEVVFDVFGNGPLLLTRGCYSPRCSD